MTERRLSIGCAVLATAAVMFPAGVWVAGALRRDAPPAADGKARAVTSADASMRNPYSAIIRTDPHVLDAQRAVVEAMERACMADSTRCAEAASARRYLDERMEERR